MTKIDHRTSYSYRQDPDVPAFDDSGPITVMDGECALCSFGARLIARFDRREEFRICRVQTPLGHALMRHYGLDPADPASWIYLEDGHAFTSFDGMIRAGRRVGGVGRLIQPFRLVPRGVQDWLYVRLARNRYRVFGRAEMCALPDPRLRARLMDNP